MSSTERQYENVDYDTTDGLDLGEDIVEGLQIQERCANTHKLIGCGSLG
jgi:hypothetical protein